jgi:cytochrome P450
MVSTQESKPHSERKRMMSNIYSKSNVQTSKELREISRNIINCRFLPILQFAAAGGIHTDILEVSTAYSMDFTSAYLLGAAKATNFLQNIDERKRALQLYRCRKPYMFWVSELPTLTKLLGRVGVPIVPKPIEDATDELEDWFLKLISDATNVEEGVPSEAIVYKQMVTGFEKFPLPAGVPKDRVIASELLDHAIAGFETNAIVLTYATWNLSQRPEMVKALRREMLTLSPPLRFPMKEGDDLPTPRSIDNLPLLNAVIQETLRLYPPSPGPQPRVTPATPSTILGHANIPGNVRISANAYSLHRNAEVYPEPEKWNPERWLEEEKEVVDERYRLFWTFGSGGRMCIGNHFALQCKSTTQTPILDPS